MQKKVSKSEAGFTLTEILVVVVIIGLLSSVVLFNVVGARTSAQMTTARANISALSQNLELYSAQIGTYPTEDQGLDALVEAPAGLANAARYQRGGYIQNLPVDPWGRPYQYIFPAERSRAAYDVFSYGADGEVGGEEDNADIGNWN